VTKVRSLEPGVSGIQQEKPEVRSQRSEVRSQKRPHASIQNQVSHEVQVYPKGGGLIKANLIRWLIEGSSVIIVKNQEDVDG
jgi:hypothetical protein